MLVMEGKKQAQKQSLPPPHKRNRFNTQQFQAVELCRGTYSSCVSRELRWGQLTNWSWSFFRRKEIYRVSERDRRRLMQYFIYVSERNEMNESKCERNRKLAQERKNYPNSIASHRQFRWGVDALKSHVRWEKFDSSFGRAGELEYYCCNNWARWKKSAPKNLEKEKTLAATKERVRWLSEKRKIVYIPSSAEWLFWFVSISYQEICSLDNSKLNLTKWKFYFWDGREKGEKKYVSKWLILGNYDSIHAPQLSIFQFVSIEL